MPKVTIYEKDLTRAAQEQENNNVAYIPGYAIMGPVNEPTLCNTLDEFTAIFGEAPYKFRTRQSYPSTSGYGFTSAAIAGVGDYAAAGDLEKSYVYATELLNNGLPILFERVMSADKLADDKWKAKVEIPFLETSDVKFVISAKNPGNYGTFIDYSFDPVLSNVSSTITISDKQYKTNAEINVYSDAGMKSQLEDTSGKPITIEAETILEVLEDNLSGVLKIKFIVETSEQNFAYVSKDNVDEITKESYLEYGSQVKATSKIAGVVLQSDTTYDSRVSLSEGDTIVANSNIALGSKINGRSADGYFYEDETIVGNKLTEYVLNVNLTSTADAYNYGLKQTIKLDPITLSFDPQSDNYYSRLATELIDLKVSGTTSSEFYTLGITTDNITGDLKLDDETRSGEQLLDEFTVLDLYTKMSSDLFDKLTDKGEYQIKFITSGSYPTFEYNDTTNNIENIIVRNMLSVAGTRGDSLAIIDHVNNINRQIGGTGTSSIYNSLQSLKEVDVGTIDKREDGRKYGAMFTPYALYNCKVINKTSILPGSFAYLLSLSESTKTNENWYAVAGVTRGLVPNLIQVQQVVTGAVSEQIQSEKGISINPITNIKPYGYCIWGNRTLNYNDGLVASSFLNIRALTNDVKKFVYTAARKLTFELNSDILWLNFRSEIEPELDRMVSGNGLRGYKIIKKTSKKKATIEAIIRLFAIEAIEDWDITIELADNYVSVE